MQPSLKNVNHNGCNKNMSDSSTSPEIKNFNTILIANRGEIAVRVIGTARKLGYTTVAIYSDADRDALHVKLADKAVAIGGRSPGDSYLSIQKILNACVISGADAVHPGYGFLSENAEFARACAGAGITFIGPSARAIHLMGNKSRSKELMESAGVPCIPGYHGAEQSTDYLFNKGLEIGFPLMIKASAGGGGRGLRIAYSADELSHLIELAKNESDRAFGSNEVLLERAFFGARHVEIQVIGDNNGNLIHLGERDCSIQRRHQKVFEESPSPAVDDSLRERMGEAAVLAARSISYSGVGTVEFLLDAEGDFYFLEMNTRLQVEHPVTEMITGIDLVQWQLMVAAGHNLPLTQEQVRFKGHAIEARLYAEDPDNGFGPQVGDILFWKPSSTDFARTDHGLHQIDSVSPYYDAMLAKIIAYAPDRQSACRLLRRALCDTAILGIKTNREFLVSCIDEDEFAQGKTDTGFIERTWPRHANQSAVETELILMAGALMLQLQQSNDPDLAGWSSNADMRSFLRLSVNGGVSESVEVACTEVSTWRMRIKDVKRTIRVLEVHENFAVFQTGDLRRSAYFARSGNTIFISCDEATAVVTDTLFDPPSKVEIGCDGTVVSPSNGLLTSIEVTEGQFLNKGDVVCSVEAMKLIQTVAAPIAGVVTKVGVTLGQQVKCGQLLVQLDPVTLDAVPGSKESVAVS